MPSYSVATTKDHLSSLIDKVLAGEEVIITRHGKPTVAIVATKATTSGDVAAVTARLQSRIAGQGSLAIPVAHFREWLYQEDDY